MQCLYSTLVIYTKLQWNEEDVVNNHKSATIIKPHVFLYLQLLFYNQTEVIQMEFRSQVA